MAEILILEFSAEGALDLYKKVSRRMGLDPNTGSGDWPDGQLTHITGIDGNDVIAVEVWESKGDQEKFMSNRLGPALEAENVPPPRRVAWFSEAGNWRRS